jgi:Nickel responsive protein SCO4226-like
MEDVMRKYMIEREMPKIGSLGAEQLRESAAKSNQVLRQLGPDIQWLESFITGDKMYCMYLAKNEALIRRHAELSGFPATRVTEIGARIDPTTAA